MSQVHAQTKSRFERVIRLALEQIQALEWVLAPLMMRIGLALPFF